MTLQISELEPFKKFFESDEILKRESGAVKIIVPLGQRGEIETNDLQELAKYTKVPKFAYDVRIENRDGGGYSQGGIFK